MAGLAAGIDLGGTNVAIALIDDRHQVVERSKVATPQGGPAAVVDAIAEAVRGLEGRADAIGVGAPGPISVDGTVRTAPNLPGWDGPVPLGRLLREALERPVFVDNDANVGVVGEWYAGAGRGSRFLLGVWMGTGVGGGLVLDGRPYRGAFGAAGEFGHMTVHLGGALCGCGRRGCVEAYAGRASMESTVEAAAGGGRPTMLLELRGDKPRMKSGVWAKALEQDDPLAAEVVEEAVQAAGAGIAAAVNLLDLDRVVIGGGLTEKLGQPLVDRIATAAYRGILVTDVDRQFRAAELGDDAGVVGAAALARAAALTG